MACYHRANRPACCNGENDIISLMTITDSADISAVARFQQWRWQFNRSAVGTVLSAVGIMYEWRVFP